MAAAPTPPLLISTTPVASPTSSILIPYPDPLTPARGRLDQVWPQRRTQWRKWRLPQQMNTQKVSHIWRNRQWTQSHLQLQLPLPHNTPGGHIVPSRRGGRYRLVRLMPSEKPTPPQGSAPAVPECPCTPLSHPTPRKPPSLLYKAPPQPLSPVTPHPLCHHQPYSHRVLLYSMYPPSIAPRFPVLLADSWRTPFMTI